MLAMVMFDLWLTQRPIVRGGVQHSSPCVVFKGVHRLSDAIDSFLGCNDEHADR
jgi:hypothetical protein